MELTDLNNVFDLKYGNKFDANKMVFIKNGEINFISRNSKNNGCVGAVKKFKDTEPNPDGLITVSLGGVYLLSSFVQPKKFYTAQNVAILTPKKEMSLNEKIYYCRCISMNRFRYSSTGREANKTLKSLKLPKSVPEWVLNFDSGAVSNFNAPFNNNKIILEPKQMKEFFFNYLFEVKKGKRVVVSKQTRNGDCPVVSASRKNNGIRSHLDLKPNHEGNTITVSYNGSVGEAFYQSEPFWATDDVNVLYPKFELNPFLAMFLITLIRKEKYRFSFGRKWHKERMDKSTIKLPVDKNGKPDWQFMGDFIKSLPYSNAIMKI